MYYCSHGAGSSQAPAPRPGRHRRRRRTIHRLAHNDPVNDLALLLTPEGRALLDQVRDTAPAEELAVATRLRRDHP
ncbi:SAM-dependent methyltransferase, partial [Streptomyces tricolor]